MTTSEQSDSGGLIELQGCVRIDGKPFVITLVDGKKYGQLTPAEALNHGIRAIQAAVEAERDAATVLGLKKMGLGEQEIAGFIAMVRDHRGQVDPDPRQDVPPEKGSSS